jgi:hypothetical protein
MDFGWRFHKVRPGDKNREPIMGEFFSTDAISNAAEALVREGIQNALDAGLNKGKVRVRIYISGKDGALSATKARKYFTGAWEHYETDGNGLLDRPLPLNDCEFLVFEDFGTSGLTGDTDQWHDQLGVKNPFYYFFRAEGQSAKGEQDRGRWGVGKTVFPRSSRISTYFGFTVRYDDRQRLLMGQSILKSHSVGSEYFSPDGYFGVTNYDGLTLPIDDKETIDQFCEDFRLERNTETGLSIVVPYSDPEISDKSLLVAVCRDYFYPILAGKLEVTVESPTRSTQVNYDTISEVAAKIEKELPKGLLDVISLAEWATELPPAKLTTIREPSSDIGLEWSAALMTDEQVNSLRDLFQAGERIAVRIPLLVREKKTAPKKSYFDVFLTRQNSNEDGRPVFIREGIIISDIRGGRSRGVLSIVVAEDQPLATLLGDSENPAHTQWQKDSSHFKGKYTYGPKYIQFVIRSVAEIVKLLAESEDSTDPSLLLDFFSIPAPEPTATKEPRKEKKKPGGGGNTPPLPAPAPARFRVHRVAGGFSVTPGADDAALPPFLKIVAAYDIRKGNPLGKYDPADFTFKSLSVEPTGMTVLLDERNQMVVKVDVRDFHLSVSGFDEQRDLYLKVSALEEYNDSKA